MHITILSNQINIPPTNEPIIYARSMHHQLARIIKLPLTLIHAPSGYGKTTTVAHWCMQQALPVAWITLDVRNQQPQIFAQYIVAALHNAALVSDDTKSQQAHQNSQNSIDTLLSILHTIEFEYILVIDNLHEIQSSYTWDIIQALIHHLPHTTHMVLIGRCIPPFSLTEAYLKGHINHIDKKDLSFSHEDVAQYLSRVTYRGHTAETITDQSEGWAIAVRMFAHNHDSLLQNNEQHKLWRQFFATIVNQHPAEIQQVISVSVAFSRFNAQLLAVMLPEIDTDACIAYLYAHQLFVESDDDTNEWHRYHRIFAMELCTQPDHDTQAIHLRGAAWLAQQGLYDDALVIYGRYQQYEHILVIMQHHAQAYLQHGEFDQFLASMAIIPIELLAQQPKVALAYAWALIMRGEYEQCHRVLHMFEAHPITASDDYIVVHTICRFYRTGIVNRTVFQQPEFTRLYAQYPFLHGLAALFTEDMTATDHQQSIRQPIANLYSSTRILLRQGEYARIHLYCQESLNNPPRHPLLAAIYGIWAEAAYALNLNTRANQLAADAHSLAQTLGNHHIRLLSATLRVHTLRVVNQDTEAQQLWVNTYREALQQQMIPLGRVYILKELWRHALINQQLDDCHTIQQQLYPNLDLIDVPADVIAQLSILRAYTTWCGNQHISTDLLQIAVDSLQQQWQASFVAAMLLLNHCGNDIPVHITHAYRQLNPSIQMPGVMRDWEHILNHRPKQSPHHAYLKQTLTSREYEVFVLAADGLTNHEIAFRLSISLSTVKTHLIHIYEKLHIKRRTDLVHLATHRQIQP